MVAEILVVDDNSGDGTAEICEKLAESYRLRLETRQHERGLSSAVIRGLELAPGDVLVVMDADLSHPPEKIPELLEALDCCSTPSPRDCRDWACRLASSWI